VKVGSVSGVLKPHGPIRLLNHAVSQSHQRRFNSRPLDIPVSGLGKQSANGLMKKLIRTEKICTICSAISFLLLSNCFTKKGVFHEENRNWSDSSRCDQHVLRCGLLAQWQVRECLRD
jgi:hypothetical protein